MTALKRFQFKVPLLDGPSYIYRACERKRWFLIQSNIFWSLPSRKRAFRKSAVQRKERVKRESATFATTTRRNCVAAWLALMVGAWEELKLVTSRHIASHGWLANHLNALRFRCWACDMRWNLHVMSNSSSVTTRECCQHTHTSIQERELLANKRGVSQSKITVSESKFNRFKISWFGKQLYTNNTSEQVH